MPNSDSAPNRVFLFQRSWFEQIDRCELPHTTRSVRFWDLAATEPSSASPDPDYTAGLRLDLDDRNGIFYLTDLIRVRKAPGAVEQLVAATAQLDGKAVRIIIEQEPGAAGRTVTDRYKRHVLRGYNVRGERATGAKDVRASVVAAAAENGLIKIVRGRNTNEFLDELTAFPHAPHDDCVDALSGAHQALSQGRGQLRSYVPRGSIYEFTEGVPRDRTRSPRSCSRSRNTSTLMTNTQPSSLPKSARTSTTQERCDSEPSGTAPLRLRLLAVVRHPRPRFAAVFL